MGQISGPTLYLFFQAGCDHCAAAKRFLGPFREAHPNLLFVELDVSKFPWEIAKYTPKMTPAYLLTINKNGIAASMEHFDLYLSDRLRNLVHPRAVEDHASSS